MPGNYLIDGSSLGYRAFFALPDTMVTSSGQMTNAVYGFTSMLVSLVGEHHPDGLAVAFDRPEPTFRDAIVSDYKAGRPETPDVLISQLDLIRQICSALAIPALEVVGYEADDVLATLATMSRDQELEAVVVTGDRDCFQLVEDPWIRVLYNRRGVSDYVLYDEAGIEERCGVRPRLYPSLAALRGDKSDNLAGVPGVGEKTAARLLVTYGDLDGVFAHVDELSPKLSAALSSHEDQVRRNLEMTMLRRDLDLGVTLEALRPGPFDEDGARRLFARLEMPTLWPRVQKAFATAGILAGRAAPAASPGAPGEAPSRAGSKEEQAAALPQVSLVACRTAGEATDRLAALAGKRCELLVAPSWSGEPGRSALLSIGLCPVGASDGVWMDGQMGSGSGSARETAIVLEALPSAGCQISGYRLKELLRYTIQEGIAPFDVALDVGVAAYLADPGDGGASLDELAARYVLSGIAAEPARRAAGQLDLGTGTSIGGASRERAERELARLQALTDRLRDELDSHGLSTLYTNVERPLVRVLAKMEARGVRIDVARLQRLAGELTDEAARLESQVHELAGEVFNVGSTPQLRRILYEKLKLTPQRKTKTGYSTDAGTLERLRGDHPIVEALLRYREVEKLRSTYGDSLLAEVAADGRIHASFNQTVARTGRLSSDRPNLQNIPVRTGEGRKFRDVFVPEEGWWFCVADYDQIELRIIAHLSGDPGLLSAFGSGVDVHRAVAASVFGVSPEEVTAEQRERAKMVSYGLAYGMEAYGLAQRLRSSMSEAGAILDAYFAAFPRLRAWMAEVVEKARESGYTETLYGRRRPLPELSSPNPRIRQGAERQAINAGTQGLAADIFKVALVAIDTALESRGLASRLVLQVHDEVIVEVPEDERDESGEVVRSSMERAYELSVPLSVHQSWGRSWGEAKR